MGEQMGTKQNPGKYDCLEKAGEDEPVFVLVARDPSASFLVACWAAVRSGDGMAAIAAVQRAIAATEKARKGVDAEKVTEAYQCSEQMAKWYSENQ